MRERSAGWRAQRRRDAWGRGVLLGVVVFALIVPLIWTLLASFEINPEANGWPPAWTLPPSAESYAEVMTQVPSFPRVYATSLIVSITATLLTIGTAFLAAYSLARWRFRGTRAVVQSFLVLASLPAMAYVIPLSDFTRELHLRDTFAGVALASAAVYAPLAVFILYGYLEQVPRSLEEIALLEGARLFQIAWKVVVPASAPGLAATAMLILLLHWNIVLRPTARPLNHDKNHTGTLGELF